MRVLGKALTAVENALAALSISYLVGIVLLIAWDVVGRRITGTSIPWIVEVAEFFLLFSAFMCSSWVLRERGHIVVDFIDAFLSEQGLRMLRMLAFILSFLTTLYLLWFTSRLGLDYLERGSFQGNFVHVPQWIVYAPVPVGLVLFMLELVRQFFLLLRRKD